MGRRTVTLAHGDITEAHQPGDKGHLNTRRLAAVPLSRDASIRSATWPIDQHDRWQCDVTALDVPVTLW
ncbi:MAG: hypothetical protein ACODAD_13455 [Planctomycetota bacterium]